MTAIDYCLCIEELARVDPSVSLSVAAHNGLGPAHIAMFGSEAQKVRWLVPLARGEKLGAWALTEPEAGSDAAGTRTTATRDGDDWVLNGTKTFITHGASADVMVVMAVDRPQPRRERHLGVRRRARDHGVQRRPQGRQAGHARERDDARCIFERCVVPADHMLGEEGQGFIQALQVLDAGRIGIAALVGRLGAGRLRRGAPLRARTPAVRSADRVVSGDSMEAGRHGDADRSRPAAHVSRRVPEGSGPQDDARVGDGEAVCERDCGARRRRAVQIHGGYGFVKDYPAEKFFRDVKLTTIGEGTSEIQRLVIARQLLG